MTSQYPNISERLSHTFATWQMMMLGYRSHLFQCKQLGYEVSEHQFRVSTLGQKLPRMILDNSITEFPTAEWVTDFNLDASDTLGRNIETCYVSFPAELLKWNRTSRRVFQIPHALQSVLANATFPDMQWNDILWPFESFVLALGKPFTFDDPRGGQEMYDTLMVSIIPSHHPASKSGRQIVVRAMMQPNNSKEKLGMSISDMSKYSQLMKKGRYKEARLLCHKRYRKVYDVYLGMQGSMTCFLDVDPGSDEKVKIESKDLAKANQQILDENPEEAGSYVLPPEHLYDLHSTFFKVALGWMLYMENLPNKALMQSKATKQKTRLISGGAPAIITEPDHIFDVVGKGRISSSEVTHDKKNCNGVGYVRPHWRRAHYKRPPGTPSDAPKTVRVPAVLVRADLVPLYGIIGGTTTVIISDN